MFIAGQSARLPVKSTGSTVVNSVDEAIDHVTAHGLVARRWDVPAAPGSLAVAREVVQMEDGLQLYVRMVLISPKGSAWRVSFDMFPESDHTSLAEAVEVAESWVTNRHPLLGKAINAGQ